MSKQFDVLMPVPEQLAAIDASIAERQRERRTFIAQQQRECDHSNMAPGTYGDAPYVPNDWGTSHPPIRICFKCGMTEDGWGCGEIVLHGDYPITVDRDWLYRKQRGLHITEKTKSLLLRHQTTVAALINEWEAKA